MRRKTFIHALSGLCVLLMAGGTAFAQQGKINSGPYQGPRVPMAAPDSPAAQQRPFFTNLELNACTGCNYSADNGYFILGPNNCFAPGATQWISYPFVSAKAGAVRRVQLAVTDSGFCVAGSSQFTVAIYTDACTNTPGTQIGNAVTAQAPAAPCSLATANFGTAGVTLTAGTKYWLVVTTSAAPTQNATTAVWWMANLAQAPFNLDDGNGWVAFPDGAPGAFTVL
jgi:hypothetical protein